MFEKYFKWLRDYRFPFKITHGSVQEELKYLFDNYCASIEKCECIDADVKKFIYKICDEIYKAFLILKDGNDDLGKKKLYDIFDLIKESMLTIKLGFRSQNVNIGIAKLFRVNEIRKMQIFVC